MYQEYKCTICKKCLRFYDAVLLGILESIRRHYKREHPGILEQRWRELNMKVKITQAICPCCKTPIEVKGKRFLKCPVCGAKQVKTPKGISWQYSLMGKKTGS